MSKTAETAENLSRGAGHLAEGIGMVLGSVADILDRVHRETSPPMGELCVALERRRVRPEQLRRWAERLSRGAHDLLALADRLEGARNAIDSRGYRDDRSGPSKGRDSGGGRRLAN